jgi:hypothetical protein
LVLEDVILFFRLVSHHKVRDTSRIFTDYESLRRAQIDAAYKEASFRWETSKDRGCLATIVMEWMTWIFLRVMVRSRERDF